MLRLWLPLPIDPEAESRLVGVALTSRDGASLAVGRVDQADFYDSRLARLFVAAVACQLVATSARVQQVAAAQHELERFVADLEQLDRLVLHDDTGIYAARVAHAARRRSEFFRFVARLEDVAG